MSRREIRFRAWDKKNKEMCSGFDLVFDGKDKLQSLRHDDWIQDDDFNPSGGFESPEDFILMQFTGLKDKNGMKIWEGDIIETGYGGARVIVWEDGCFHARHPNYEPGKDMPSFPVHFYGVNPDLLPIVLGNIYENPELMK